MGNPSESGPALTERTTRVYAAGSAATPQLPLERPAMRIIPLRTDPKDVKPKRTVFIQKDQCNVEGSPRKSLRNNGYRRSEGWVRATVGELETLIDEFFGVRTCTGPECYHPDKRALERAEARKTYTGYFGMVGEWGSQLWDGFWTSLDLTWTALVHGRWAIAGKGLLLAFVFTRDAGIDIWNAITNFPGRMLYIPGVKIVRALSVPLKGLFEWFGSVADFFDPRQIQAGARRNLARKGDKLRQMREPRNGHTEPEAAAPEAGAPAQA